MRRRWLPVLLGAACAVAACSSSTAPTAASAPVEVAPTISAPASALAGSLIPIDVAALTPSGAVDVVATQGWRTTRVTATADGAGQAHVDLGPPFTDRAGLVTLTAVANGRLGRSELRINAGTAIDPGTLVVGGRSIVANGGDHAMAVALPQDRLANPIEDDTPVEFALRRASGQEERSTVAISGAIAWLRFPSLTASGRTSIAAVTDGTHSPQNTIRETADDPVPFTLQATGPDDPADGRSVRVVHTSVLADAHGNMLPDGSAVTFTIDGPNGRGRAWGQTIRGVAEVSIPAPPTEGIVTVTAWSHGTASQALEVSFEPHIIEVPVRAHRAGPWAVQIDVGPVIGELGGYLADGTPVAVTLVGDPTVASDQSRTHFGYLVDGSLAQTVTADSDVQRVRVVVLGTAVNVAVSA